jgi:tyrosyl-tRNA synthetase
MSKSLGNYIGVNEIPADMYAKVMSISDDLMWRYYTLLTDLSPGDIDRERAEGRPMDSKKGLARLLVGDFHGKGAAKTAEAEWRRVHQRGQAPSDLPVVRLAPGPLKPHLLVVRAGMAKSNGEAVRLLRQRAVRRDGVVLEAGAEVVLEPGAGFVLSVGPARHVKIEVGD